MIFITNFKYWLQANHYNSNTIRNYLADVRKYLNFVVIFTQESPDNPDAVFSHSTLQTYILRISQQKNSHRYLASLSKFCQFAQSKKLIQFNPFKKIRKELLKHQDTSLDFLVQQYQRYLLTRSKNPVTVKNYINDVQQFINWAKPNIND